MSAKLHNAELNYSTTDREFLALYKCCTKWRCYLQGSHFTLYTDHEPLKYIKS